MFQQQLGKVVRNSNLQFKTVIKRPLQKKNSFTGTTFVRIGPSKSSPVVSQPKVYQKIELCRALSEVDDKKNVLNDSLNVCNECDINKNVRNGFISKIFRRNSSSSSGQCSVGSNQQADKSMIMIRKTYKKPGSKSVLGNEHKDVMTRKIYKKKIFEPDIPVKRKLEETTENKEEFYKYLGIDTKPPEKRVYKPDITNLDIFKRRSLRVRYLNIQNKSQSQDQAPGVHGKYEIKEEVSETDNSPTTKESPETKPSEVSSVKEKSLERPHDVKILRSYLKPKEKKTAKTNLLKHQLQTRSIPAPVVLLKPLKKIIKVEKVVPEQGPVKYLMRSKINLGESRLRSGLQKKSFLRPSRYLSFFKNKRALLRQRPRTEIKSSLKPKKKPIKKKFPTETNQTPPVKATTSNNVQKSLPVPVEEKPQETATTMTELPKSPISQVPDSTVNFQTPTSHHHHSLAIPAQVSTIDTMTSSAHTLKNPLNRDDGSVLFAYVLEDTLVIVQERSVSFWRYSPFKHLVGMDQTWELIGRIKRHDYGK